MTLTVMKRCRVLRTSTPGAQIIILLALFAVKHGNNECNLALDQFCKEDDDRSSPRRFVERAVSALSRNPELANGMMTGPPSMELAEMAINVLAPVTNLMGALFEFCIIQ